MSQTLQPPTQDDSFFGIEIPFIRLIGAKAEHVERGRAMVSIEVRPELTNSWGYAHGGLVMTLLDVTMGCAARSMDSNAAGVMTVDMASSFMRASSGHIVVEGRVLHHGSSLVFCEGEVRDAEGLMMAKATGTFRLRRRKGTV